MRKALTTATVFFFAGKTVEGVGKTPGSCSKTQDFQFTTPEAWPSFAALKVLGVFFCSNHPLKSSVWGVFRCALLGCVLFCLQKMDDAKN